MVLFRHWKIAALATAFAGGGWMLSCFGAQPTDHDVGYDLSRTVRFETGAKQMHNGDDITITDVHGTSDTMTAGNIYVIRGTYRLASEKKATLAAFVTESASDPDLKQMQEIPVQRTQTLALDEGNGKFKLVLYLWYNGNPHVSFYPAGGGNSFGGVYFGTGASVLK